MAIYHFSAQTINRTAGRSATAAAAYRAGEEIADERQGLIHDYTRKGGVLHSEIMAPSNAPPWASDRASLWNEVEHSEKRKDAQVAREIVVAIPHELNEHQRIDLVRGFSKSQFVDRGMIADMNFHAPDDGGDHRNFHAHIMLTMRDLGPEGFGKKNRSWNNRDTLQSWREEWQNHANRALEAAGYDARIDHRSLKDQRLEALENGDIDKAVELDREPQIHLGPKTTHILREAARQGRMPHSVLDRAAINDSNTLDIDSAKSELEGLDKQIHRLESLEDAHVEAISEDLLRSKIIDIRDQLKEKESRIYELRNRISNPAIPDFVKKEQSLRDQKEKAVSEAAVWMKNHPITTKLSHAVGYQLDVDRKVDFYTKKHEESPDTLRKVEWENQKKADISEHNSLKKEVKSLKYEMAIARKDLKTLNDPDKPASSFDLERAKDLVSEKHPEAYKAADAVVAPNTDTLAAPGGGAALGGISSGVDADLSSDIIRTGNPAIDSLAQAFRQHQKKMLADELAYVAQQAAAAAEGEKTRQASIRAVQKMLMLVSTISTGRNLAADDGKPVTRGELGKQVRESLEASKALKKAVDHDIFTTREAKEKERREAELDAALERNSAEREKEIRNARLGQKRVKQSSEKKRSRHEHDDGLSF